MVQQYKEDFVSSFVGIRHLKPDAQALRELEQENRDLREEDAILKRPCASTHSTGDKVPLYQRKSLQVSYGEDAQRFKRVTKRLLSVFETIYSEFYIIFWMFTR